jgi:hypothetical protein
MTAMVTKGEPAVDFKNRYMNSNGESISIRWHATIINGWYLAQATFES